MNWNLESLPLLAEVDVAVAGGGTAGAIAAISAAREGAKTLVIERYGALGGTGTLAQVTPLMSLKIPQRPDPSSLNALIKSQMIKEGTGAEDKHGQDGWFNPFMLPFLLDRLLQKWQGQVLFDATVIGVVKSGEDLAGLVVHTRAGLGLVKARCFIDATADASVAYMADVPCKQGREQDGTNQAVSLRFTMGGIDLAKLQDFLAELGQAWGLELPLLETASLWDRADFYPLEKVFRKGLEQGLITYEDGRYIQAFTVPGMPAAMAFNCPEIPGINQALNPFSTSRSYMIGRDMTGRLINFFRKLVPGFENCYLVASGPMLGVRESRRIEGEYCLSIDDYLHCRKWPDGIAQTAYPIDIHGEEGLTYADKPVPEGDFFEIPYTCLIPRKVNKLLVAGRCISATFAAQSAIRIQPVCRATGEAAGIAAAWLAADNSAYASLRKIDGAAIRRRMIEYGGVFADDPAAGQS